MTRCDEFYCKYQRLRDLGPDELKAFCDKNPETIRRIDILLDDLIPLIKNEAAKSEILNLENTPIGGIVSEGALRPLMSEHDPEIRGKIAGKIVKKAEEKTIDGENPRVTHREVDQIIREVRGEEIPWNASRPKPTRENYAKQFHEPPPLTDDQKAALDQYVHEIATKPKVPITWQNASHHDMLLEIGDEMTCPKCGKTARLMLKWTCCDLSIEEAQDLADEIVKQAIDVAEERFRERQRMNGKGVTSS